jgi:hypothetical protein
MRKWNGNGDSYAKIVSELIGDYFNDEVKSRTELERDILRMEINFSKVKNGKTLAELLQNKIYPMCYCVY